MENNTFDKYLKTALEDMDVPYEPATWSLLSNKLDAIAAVEASEGTAGEWMDAPLSEKLGRIEVPFQSAHWDLMAARLEEAKRRRRRVWMSKLAEAAIFLLLLLNLQTWIGGRPADGSEEKSRHAISPQASTRPAKGNQRHTRPTVAAAAVNAANAENLLSAFSTGAGITQLQASDPVDVLHPENNQTAEADIIASILKPLLNSDAAQQLREQQQAAQPIASDLQTLPAYALQGLVLPPHNLSDGPTAVPFTKKSPHQNRFYVSAQAGLQLDRVSGGGDLHNRQNAGGGLAAGYRKGKWGVEGGIVYNRKRFQPKKAVEIYAGNAANGYYGAYLAEVDADVISVPLHATRQIAKVGKVSAHAVAGLTANVATQKGYRHKSVYYPGSSPSGPDPNQQGNKPLFRQEGVGFLENGGQLSGNTYVSADAGFRVEAPISRRATVFVESTYRHALPLGEGLAPQPTNIHTVAINAGVMTGF